MAPPDRGAISFIYPPTSANIGFFAEALNAGCVIGMPTETVYGLAARADSEQGCRAVFAIKGRPLLDPLILHAADLQQIEAHAFAVPELALVADMFWPGPLTVILKKRPNVSDLVTAGLGTVAIRMPAHPVAQELIRRCGAPLAAPSANPFGYVSPSTAAHVAESFGNRVPFIIDGGPCTVGLESTILNLSEGPPFKVLRPGAISAQALAECIGCEVDAPTIVESDAARPMLAPGTSARHYSPLTPLYLVPFGMSPTPGTNRARVFLQRPAHPQPHDFWFSETGQIEEIGRQLFSLLRRLDQAAYASIHCELAQPEGIGIAINDRLRRASSAAIG